MKKVTLFIVLVCLFSGANAAKWSNGQQKQNAKKLMCGPGLVILNFVKNLTFRKKAVV